MTKYLPIDAVVRINAEHGGDGAGVLNLGGIEAQLGRASSGSGGYDFYPSIWQKAAVLIHGLASTQYFSDGNKRTAWLVADAFLSINDVPLREIPDVEAESFVLTVALNLFSIEKAAEWLEGRRLRASDRCQFAFLAGTAHLEGSTADLQDAFLGALAFTQLPDVAQLTVVARILWVPLDVHRPRTVRVWIEDDHGPLAIWNPADEAAAEAAVANPDPWRDSDDVTLTCVPMPASNIAHHKSGVFPDLITQGVTLVARSEGTAKLRIDIDDDFFAEIPISIHLVSALVPE